MTGERSPEQNIPSLQALEFAGALQGVIGDVAANREFQLDLHQEEALKAIGGGIVNGETTGYIDSATGSGKGLLIALLAEAAVRAGKRVLILAPTTQIADQLIGADEETGIGRFTGLLGKGFIKQHYGNRRGNTKDPIQVSTYAGFLEETKAIDRGKGRLGDFDLILGDECHKSLGDQTSDALYRYMPRAIKIGFSATPDYADDRKSEEVWGKPWFEFSLREAIETGKAAPVRALLMATDSTIELTDYRNEFTERELAPLINNPDRNGLALKFAQDFVAEGRQGIMSCVAGHGNKHAIIMADLLSKLEVNGRPIVARAVGSHISKDEQRRRLQAYRNGEIDVLTFTKALEEGWDSNRASFCLNLSPSTSPVRIKQLLGRLARPKPDGRESIFVDFLDETEGVNKIQYTAAHALDVERIDLNRVLGWGHASARTQAATPRSLDTYIRPELYARLMRAHGRTLADVLVSGRVRTPIDPLVVQWERTLAREGMPAELPYNVAFTPLLEKKYQQAAGVLLRLNGQEPTSNEVADFLAERGVATKEQEKVVRELGQRVLLEDGAITNSTQARESVEDIVARIALKTALEKVLETMSEREKAVLSLRNGINDEKGKERNLDEVGKVIGVTRERVRQIESKALGKMRHPSRFTSLTGFIGPTYEESTGNSLLESAKGPANASLFSKLPGADVPLHDTEDQRPYIDRLKEVSDIAAERWLEENVALLDKFITTQLRSPIFLNRVAQSMTSQSDQESESATAINVHAVRAQALTGQQADVNRELSPLRALRNRVAGRPMHPQSQASRNATLTVLDARIDALSAYSDIIQNHIARYAKLATLSKRAASEQD